MIDAHALLMPVLQASLPDVEDMTGEVHYVPFDPEALPRTSGIYLIFHEQECLYIGQARNMRQRWVQHHRLPELQRLNVPLTMAGIEAPVAALLALEVRLILQLQPRLNGERESQRRRGRLVALTVKLPPPLYLRLKRLGISTFPHKTNQEIMVEALEAYLQAHEA